MTEERQAVKTLAEELVKAMKSVNKTSSQKSMGTSGTVLASKIVGLPAAFSSIISGIEESAAAGDAVAQQTLTALNHIAAGEFETITADTAMIDKVYATFGDFVNLIAENAVIGDLDVDSIRASMGVIGLLTLTTADIQQAQIDHLSADNAFLRYGVGGKLYIDDLAVSNANIVNLAAGTILLNDSNGDLVELYVDATTGDVTTRAVSYDGSDIINQNSLNGNRIVQNSITTTQLNASEIFAYQGTIMDLIADNIEATRLFANQGFIQQLQTTIISSDLSQNSTIISLSDEINLMSSNTSRTFIQSNMPIPVHAGDTWFDPSTEEHYVATGIIIPQMTFGHDDEGNLCIEENDDYQFEINANGELMVLVVNEDAEQIILDNNIDFSIVDDCIYANGLWKKIDNVAFSRLRISVDGIASEVYDSQTGESRIEQNAGRIVAIVSGEESVGYVETSSIEIKDDSVKIKSTGDVDIKADKFSVAFNTAGHLENTSRVEISDGSGIKVSDQYGNYFQATSTKIGLYDIQDNARLYMDNTGHAFFNGYVTLGGSNNVNGALYVKNSSGNNIVVADKDGIRVNNASGAKIGEWNSNGIGVWDSSGANKQFYIDGNTGNATFAGTLNAAGGTFSGSLSAATGTFAGSLSAATGTFAGTMSAACITSGALNVDVISRNSITVNKLTGEIINDNWKIDLTNGTFTIGNISANNITSGTLTLGGNNNTKGTLVVNNASGTKIGEWNNSGISIWNSGGTTKQFYIDSSTGNATFAGNLNAAGGTFSGTVQASGIRGTKSLGNSWSIDFTNGSMTIGSVSADKITGTKSLGNNWSIDFSTGSMTIGDISANSIKSGTLSANYISGGTLTLGGNNNTSGTLVVNNASGTKIGEWNNSGIGVWNSSGATKQFYIDAQTGNATFAGNLNAAGGTFSGDLSAAGGTFKGSLSAATGTFAGDLSAAGGTFSGNLSAAGGTFSGNLSAAGGTFKGSLSAATGTFAGTMSADSIRGGSLSLGGEYGSAIWMYNENKEMTGSWQENGIDMYNNGLISLESRSKKDFLTLAGYYINMGTRYTSNSTASRFEITPYDTNGIIGIDYLRSDDTHHKNGHLIFRSGVYPNVDNSVETEFKTPVTIKQGLTVTGTKSRVVSTSQYSDRLLYCYETPSPLFGDVGEGQISQDGKCYIHLDAVFAQTISTDQYQVFLQKYGEGNCYVSERHGSYFVVSGTPNMQFGWELKAKQSDFDQLRLERNDELFRIPYQSYGEDIISHIEEIRHERLSEESEEN